MEHVAKLFALIIWYKDTPVTGNVVNLNGSAVKKPRKEADEYKVGEYIQASCQGIKGIFPAVIAQIAGEEGKAGMTSVLSDNEAFQRLVKLFPDPTPETQLSNPEHIQDLQKPDKPTQTKTKAAGNKNKKESDKTISGATKKQVEGKPTKKSSEAKNLKDVPVPTKNLEKAAADLEFTELENTLSMLTDEFSTSQETSSVVAESYSVLNHDNEVMQNEDSLPTIRRPQTKCRGCQTLETDVQGLQQRVDALENRLENSGNKVATLESNLTWLWNQHQQLLARVTQLETAPSGGFAGPVCAPLPSNVSQNSHESNEAGKAGQEPEIFSGYTKEQLATKISIYPDFSKATKYLFRLLFKKEEWVGRSLTGAKQKKSAPIKERIEDHGRLAVIYDVVRQKFPGVTISIINGKIAEILKPSMTPKE